MKALEMIPSWSEPRATSAIAEIRNFIGQLLEKGSAYEINGSVYFDIGGASNFGDLSGLKRDEMIALAAERGGNPNDPQKRDPLDLSLIHI